jgi:long-chain acyl-CoA synthetase
MHRGSSIGFTTGDVTRLLDDLAVLAPTVFPSVPRLWNRSVRLPWGPPRCCVDDCCCVRRIYDKVMAGVAEAPALRRALFNYALSSKTVCCLRR